jgi:hypothetical protein
MAKADNISTIDPARLARVIGAGAKDAAFCSQLRAQGMQFGNGLGGGKVADKLLGGLHHDGVHAGVSRVGTSIVGAISPKIVKSTVESALPDFCKR